MVEVVGNKPATWNAGMGDVNDDVTAQGRRDKA